MNAAGSKRAAADGQRQQKGEPVRSGAKYEAVVSNRRVFDRATVAVTAIERIVAKVLTPEKRQKVENRLRDQFAQVQHQAIDVDSAAVDTANEIEKIVGSKATLEQWQGLKDCLLEEFVELPCQAIKDLEPVDE
jgi:hypothetical protein